MDDNPAIKAVLIRQVRQYYVRYDGQIYSAVVDSDHGANTVDSHVYFHDSPVYDEKVKNGVLDMIAEEEARIKQALIDAHIKALETDKSEMERGD